MFYRIPAISHAAPAKKGSSVANLANELVPRLLYEEKEQECIAKEEQIQVNCFVFSFSISFNYNKQTKIDFECESKAIRAFVTFERCSNPRFDRQNRKNSKNKEIN